MGSPCSLGNLFSSFICYDHSVSLKQMRTEHMKWRKISNTLFSRFEWKTCYYFLFAKTAVCDNIYNRIIITESLLSSVTNNESYAINHHTNLPALMKSTLMGMKKPTWFTSNGVIDLRLLHMQKQPPEVFSKKSHQQPFCWL